MPSCPALHLPGGRAALARALGPLAVAVELMLPGPGGSAPAARWCCSRSSSWWPSSCGCSGSGPGVVIRCAVVLPEGGLAVVAEFQVLDVREDNP